MWKMKCEAKAKTLACNSLRVLWQHDDRVAKRENQPRVSDMTVPTRRSFASSLHVPPFVRVAARCRSPTIRREVQSAGTRHRRCNPPPPNRHKQHAVGPVTCGCVSRDLCLSQSLIHLQFCVVLLGASRHLFTIAWGANARQERVINPLASSGEPTPASDER